MRKPKKLFKVLGILGVLFLFAPQISAYAAPLYAGTDNTNVWYKAHVQNVGWQNTVVNGDLAGTTGKALQIEAMQIDVSDSAQFSIEYNAYVKSLGWVGVQRDGQTIGTTGQNLPMYGICIAIKDKNTKQDSANYDIYYRVHVRDIGWKAWTKNGELSGDTDNGKPIEAIEIQIRLKGQEPVTGGSQNGRQALLSVAKSQIGYTAGSNKYTKYGDWYGLPNADWCAMFVSWCANEAGIGTNIIPKHASCGVGINWFKSNGTWKSRVSGYTPIQGDLIYYDYENDGFIDHVGIVESVSNGTITSIEGNVGGGNGIVARQYHSLNNTDIIGYGTPNM